MKQELHICDRCGDTIELVPENGRFRTLIQKKRRIPAHISKEICKRNGYVTEEFLKNPEISSASIVEYYNFERSEYDLCPKCRKDFERFMEECTKECECVQCGNAIKDALNPDSFLCGSAKRKNSK